MQTFGEIGTLETADLLRHHRVHDAELGQDAVAAAHVIDTDTRT